MLLWIWGFHITGLEDYDLKAKSKRIERERQKKWGHASFQRIVDLKSCFLARKSNSDLCQNFTNLCFDSIKIHRCMLELLRLSKQSESNQSNEEDSCLSKPITLCFLRWNTKGETQQNVLTTLFHTMKAYRNQEPSSNQELTINIKIPTLIVF